MEGGKLQANKSFPKVIPSSLGLRPLEPSKAPAFWDSINFEIGGIEPHGDEDELKYSIEGASSSDVSSFSKPDPSSVVSPFSKPDPSCFVQYYAPLQPLIVLPNNFSITTESLSELSLLIGEYLKSRDDVSFSSPGSSWSGNILRTSCHCAFRICIYRHRTVPGVYIVEGQRVEGDGFLFGYLWNGVEETCRTGKVTSRLKKAEAEVEAEVEAMEVDNALSSQFAENVKVMLVSEDTGIKMNGIIFASEMATDASIVSFIFELDILSEIINMLTTHHQLSKWHVLHAIIALEHLSVKQTERFNAYLHEKNLSLVLREILGNLLLVYTNRERDAERIHRILGLLSV